MVRKPSPAEERLAYEVGGIALITAGAILLASIAAGSSGIVTQKVNNALFIAVGVGAYAVPLVAIAFGLLLVWRLRGIRLGNATAGFLVLLLALLTLISLPAPYGQEFAMEQARARGGYIGAALAVGLKECVGLPAAYIFVLGLCCVAAAVISTRPLKFALRQGAAALAAGMGAARAWLAEHREELRRRSVARGKKVRRRRVAPRRREPSEPAPSPVPEPPPHVPLREVSLRRRAGRKARPPEWLVPQEKGQLHFAPALGVDREDRGEYTPPSEDLLNPIPKANERQQEAETAEVIRLLEETLASFNVEAKVVSVERGPTVTRYEVEPAKGIRVSKIAGLADDLALSLAAIQVRVEAPVPGKSVVGIEVPNKRIRLVTLREMFQTAEFRNLRSPLGFAIGRDIAGNPVVGDLARLPHLLVAGATNSGKSVFLACLVLSLLYRARPDQVKFIMIDPKRVELTLFDGIPHLLAPVVHDARTAAGLLRQAINEMEKRYHRLSEAGVRNITEYNQRAREKGLPPMYYIVIVIDELADLMMQGAAEFEHSICRIAQLARAVGLHLVVATQRPSVNVVTGTIKANIPSRIAFAVASQTDSRVVLDRVGAERLVGRGDMLYLPIDAAKPRRIQGAYVDTAEIERVVAFLREQGGPEEIMEPAPIEDGPMARAPSEEQGEDLELMQRIMQFVMSQQQVSTSMLQRRFRIGYNRAARIMDELEARGLVGPADGSRPRKVLHVAGISNVSLADEEQ